MNENLFASFITPTLMGLPIIILIISVPNLLFPAPNRLIIPTMIKLVLK